MLTAAKQQLEEAAPDDEAQREAARLAALDSYDILDTPAEEAFDRITRIARNVFGTSMSTVTFVDGLGSGSSRGRASSTTRPANPTRSATSRCGRMKSSWCLTR